LFVFLFGIANFGVVGKEADTECLDTVGSVTVQRANHAANKLTN